MVGSLLVEDPDNRHQHIQNHSCVVKGRASPFEVKYSNSGFENYFKCRRLSLFLLLSLVFFCFCFVCLLVCLFAWLFVLLLSLVLSSPLLLWQ